MKNLKFIVLIISVTLLCGVGSVCAQDSTTNQILSEEKKALIEELRPIIGIDKYRIKQEIGTTDVGKMFVSMVDDDKELTAEQKQELKKAAFEAKDRMEKNIRDFLADTSIADQLFTEVSIQVFDVNFTTAELQEMVAFYRTPTGRKTVKFMMGLNSRLTGTYTNAFKQKIGEFIKVRVDAELDDLRRKIKEAKTKKLEA